MDSSKYDRVLTLAQTAAYFISRCHARDHLGRGADRHRWPRVEICDRVAEGMEAAWKLLRENPCIERWSLKPSPKTWS